MGTNVPNDLIDLRYWDRPEVEFCKIKIGHPQDPDTVESRVAHHCCKLTKYAYMHMSWMCIWPIGPSADHFLEAYRVQLL